MNKYKTKRVRCCRQNDISIQIESEWGYDKLYQGDKHRDRTRFYCG